MDSDLLQFAVSVALRAGRLAAHLFTEGARATRKADGTEVTDADVAVEALIRDEMSTRTPDDGILGEEIGQSPGRSGRRWVIDPISGTAYFTRRMPLFANLLAYEDEHGSAIGIINLPMQQELVFAARGHGCRVLDDTSGDISDGRRIQVGDRDRIDGALTLAMNQHTWSEELLIALHRRVLLVGAVHHVVAHLVAGRVDAAIITEQGYDDLAPLPVIVSEAGGVITDLGGAPVLTGDGSVLATNTRLHGQFRSIVADLPRVARPKTVS